MRIKWFLRVLTKQQDTEITQLTSVSERHYEYPFAIECLSNLKLSVDTKILDIGCSGSPLPLIIASLGYKVVGSDLNKWPIQCSNFEMVVDDIKHSNFKSASFDVITLISAIEHVGQKRYGESPTINGHLLAMDAVRRILKPNGYLILTTPYGESIINPKYHFRVFNREDIAEMSKGFTVLSQRFVAPINSSSIFEHCTEQEAMKMHPEKNDLGRHATTLMFLRKV